MQLDDDEIRVDLACGIADDDRWHGWFTVHVDAAALRRLGLHPEHGAGPKALSDRGG